jgi:glycosyltransferase involved in cell wall biosynthesis
MISEPLPLSIALITYNHKNYIEKAIDSILKQRTNFRFEIIIGEDCSVDGTREIVFEFQNKHPEIIKLITSEENVGPRKNTSRVMDACRGKYLAFIEGDDYWSDPDKLQKQYDFLNANPDCALVHSNFDAMNEQNGTIEHDVHSSYKGRLLEGLLFEDLLLYNFIATCTVFARGELVHQAIKDLKLYDGNWKMADRPLWLELARQYKIGYIPESTAVYRINRESVSHSQKKLRQFRFIESSYDIRLWFINKYGTSASTRQTVLNDFHRYKLEYAYFLNDRKLANEALRYFKDKNDLSISKYLYYLGSQSVLLKSLVKVVFFAWGPNHRLN